jgi:hypothetical protein
MMLFYECTHTIPETARQVDKLSQTIRSGRCVVLRPKPPNSNQRPHLILSEKPSSLSRPSSWLVVCVCMCAGRIYSQPARTSTSYRLLGGIRRKGKWQLATAKIQRSSNLAGEDLFPVLLGLVVPRGCWVEVVAIVVDGRKIQGPLEGSLCLW